MSKRPRRNHAPACKAKVALEAQKGDQTMVELAERYQVHPSQITEWKKLLLEHAADIFGRDKKAEQSPSVKDLHAKKGGCSSRDSVMRSSGSLQVEYLLQAGSVEREGHGADVWLDKIHLAYPF